MGEAPVTVKAYVGVQEWRQAKDPEQASADALVCNVCSHWLLGWTCPGTCGRAHEAQPGLYLLSANCDTLVVLFCSQPVTLTLGTAYS